MINLAEGCVASQKEKCLSLFCVFCFFFKKELWSPWIMNKLAMAVTRTEYLVP